MQFMVMHKVDANMEAGGPPSQDIIREMGKLVQGSRKAGTFVNGAGLHRSAERVRVKVEGGESKLTPGPFSGQNELIAACFMIRTKSLEQAIDQASRFAVILGDVEIEIGPVVEPWDLGMVPKPAEVAFKRFLLLLKGNAESERGTHAGRTAAALVELQKQMTQEGVLVLAVPLAPSTRGARLASAPKGERAWVDGPFAESKELIAGFSILSVPTKAAALAWADQYAAVLGGNEVDVREIDDAIG